MSLYEHFEILYGLDASQQQRYINDLNDAALQKELTALMAATPESITAIFEDGLRNATGVTNYEDLIGTTIGNYTLTSLLSVGGMGAVYKGSRSDGEFELTAAIKIIPASLTTENNPTPNIEAQSLANLNHPHIVHILDAGKTDSGLLFIVMSFIEGMTIDEFCQREQPDEATKLTMFLQILDAIGHAHNSQILHRDLKPHNIMVDQEQQIKVVDFGIARLISQNQSDATNLYLRALSFNYCSPEHMDGRPVTSASDIFSLGRVLFQLLTRQVPNHFEFNEQLENAKLSRVLTSIIRKATSLNASERYQITVEMKQDILAYLNKRPVVAYPSKTLDTFNWCSRNVKSIGIAAVFLIVVIAASLQLQKKSLESQQQQVIADTNLKLAETMLKQVDITNDTEFDRQLSIIESAKSIDISILPNHQKTRLLLAMAQAYKAIGDYPQFDEYTQKLNEHLVAVGDQSVNRLIGLRMSIENDVLFQRFQSAVEKTKRLSADVVSVSAPDPALFQLLDWEFKTLDRFLVPDVLAMYHHIEQLNQGLARTTLDKLNLRNMQIFASSRALDFPTAIETAQDALSFADLNADVIPIRYKVRQLVTWSELAHNRGAPPKPEVFKNEVVSTLHRLESLIDSNHPIVVALAFHVAQTLSGIEDPDYVSFVERYRDISLTDLIPAYQVDFARMDILNKIDNGRYPEAYEDIIDIMERIPLASSDSMALYQVITYFFHDFDKKDIIYVNNSRILALTDKYNDLAKASYFYSETCQLLATENYPDVDDICQRSVDLAIEQYGEEGFWTIQRKVNQFGRFVRKDLEKAQARYAELLPLKEVLTGTWKQTLLRSFVYYHLAMDDPDNARKYFDEYKDFVKQFTNYNLYNLGNLLAESAVLMAEGRHADAKQLVTSQSQDYCAKWPYDKSFMKTLRKLHRDLGITPENPCPQAITWEHLVGEDTRLTEKFL